MDILSVLTNLGSAFGLSASAGLNAYIPMLIVALTARYTNLIELGEPYSILTSLPVIAVLGVLLVIELFADKVPAVDTLNDIVQTAVRPTAGALLFAANTNAVTDINPVLAAVAGLFMAGTIHATKTAVRPAITAATAGTGNWVVSLIEDTVAFFTSILAIVMPFIVVIFFIVFLFVGGRFWFNRRRRRRAAALR